MGTLLSIGLGFFTGGLQHFPDSPARSAWVVPLGFAISILALMFTLKMRMQQDVWDGTGNKIFTFATSFALILFYAFAMQCMATLAVVKRETKSWKWPLIQLGYMGILAYLGAFITYQLLS